MADQEQIDLKCNMLVRHRASKALGVVVKIYTNSDTILIAYDFGKEAFARQCELEAVAS